MLNIRDLRRRFETRHTFSALSNSIVNGIIHDLLHVIISLDGHRALALGEENGHGDKAVSGCGPKVLDDIVLGPFVCNSDLL